VAFSLRAETRQTLFLGLRPELPLLSLYPSLSQNAFIYEGIVRNDGRTLFHEQICTLWHARWSRSVPHVTRNSLLTSSLTTPLLRTSTSWCRGICTAATSTIFRSSYVHCEHRCSINRTSSYSYQLSHSSVNIHRLLLLCRTSLLCHHQHVSSVSSCSTAVKILITSSSFSSTAL